MLATNQQSAQPQVIIDRDARLWSRANLLVRMLQGTMGLEGQAVSSASLDRLRETAYSQLSLK